MLQISLLGKHRAPQVTPTSSSSPQSFLPVQIDLETHPSPSFIERPNDFKRRRLYPLAMSTSHLGIHDSEFPNPAPETPDSRVTALADKILLNYRHEIIGDILLSDQKRKTRFRLSKVQPYDTILPWSYFPPAKMPTDKRIREALNPVYGESAESVEESLKYLWKYSNHFLALPEDIKKDVYDILCRCIQRFVNDEVRPLWSIVQLKSAFVVECRAYYASLLHKKMEEISNEINLLCQEDALSDPAATQRICHLQVEADDSLALSRTMNHRAQLAAASSSSPPSFLPIQIDLDTHPSPSFIERSNGTPSDFGKRNI